MHGVFAGTEGRGGRRRGGRGRCRDALPRVFAGKVANLSFAEATTIRCDVVIGAVESALPNGVIAGLAIPAAEETFAFGADS